MKSLGRGSAGLLLCLAALAGCKKKEEEKETQPLAVRVAAVQRGTVAQLVQVAGTLSPPPGMDVKLGPLLAGRLAEVLVAEGDRVQEGQVLARLDPTALRDAVAQAEAQLAQASAQEKNAQGKLVRAEKAFSAGVAAGQEVDDTRLGAASAQAAVRTAAAALSTARNQLGRSELRAPFAGLVAHVFAAAGEPVDAGKPVLEIARTAVLELRAPLAPDSALLVRKGQRADITVDGLPGRTFDGTVIAVAPVFDAGTGTAIARIRVENQDLVLKGGTFARARIAADVHQGVLVIPREALLAGDGGAATQAEGSVELVGPGDKAKKLPVGLGFQDDRLAEVRTGLALGDRVVIEGNYALPDGTQLAPATAAGDPAPDAGGETRPVGKE